MNATTPDLGCSGGLPAAWCAHRAFQYTHDVSEEQTRYEKNKRAKLSPLRESPAHPAVSVIVGLHRSLLSHILRMMSGMPRAVTFAALGKKTVLEDHSVVEMASITRRWRRHTSISCFNALNHLNHYNLLFQAGGVSALHLLSKATPLLRSYMTPFINNQVLLLGSILELAFNDPENQMSDDGLWYWHSCCKLTVRYWKILLSGCHRSLLWQSLCWPRNSPKQAQKEVPI